MIETATLCELIDFRKTGRVLHGQILLGEMETNAAAMHSAGFARLKGNPAPLRLFLAFELERLAGFHRRNHRGFVTFAGTNVDEAIGIVDHAATLGLNKGREREGEGEENERGGLHQDRAKHRCE